MARLHLSKMQIEKGMNGTNGFSGLPKDPRTLYPGFGMIQYQRGYEPDHEKIGPDWKPVNWLQQSKIRE
jgi:hypothetical protein